MALTLSCVALSLKVISIASLVLLLIRILQLGDSSKNLVFGLSKSNDIDSNNYKEIDYGIYFQSIYGVDLEANLGICCIDIKIGFSVISGIEFNAQVLVGINIDNANNFAKQ
jgi:hypothetical protein